MATLPFSPMHGFCRVRRQGLSCSFCGSGEIYPQRPRGLVERHIFRTFRFAPFWCVACDRRFYLRVRSFEGPRIKSETGQWSGAR